MAALSGCPFGAGAQDTLSLQCALRIPVASCVFATTDPIGNIYLITEEGAIEKYDAAGRRRVPYTQNRLGTPAYIDAANALKVLVWYPDFRTAIFLDRSLTQIGGELSLIQAGFPEVRTVAPSADGQLWLYDEVHFRLRKITPEGAPLYESQQLNLLSGRRCSFQKIMDDGARVIALDSAQGIWVFDVFGQYQQKIEAGKGAQQVQISGQMLQWIGADGLLWQTRLDLPVAEQAWSLPENVRKAPLMRLAPDGILTWEAGELKIWKGG